MIKVLLYGHAGSHNHGCEAIVRTTCHILSEKYEAEFAVASYHPTQDHKYCTDMSRITFHQAKKAIIPSSLERYIDAFSSRTIGRTLLVSLRSQPTIDLASKCDAALSVGGDNYSENNGVALSDLDMAIRRKCPLTVLWGCSLDERYLDPHKHRKKLSNLRGFSLITARESITYESLQRLGLSNVRLFPDPAFTLPPSPNSRFLNEQREVVGLNLSPLVQRFERSRGLVMRNYAALVEFILQRTDFDVLLVPHVVWPSSASDTVALERLMTMLPQSNRLRIARDGNSMDMKAMISACKLFVGARTHSTIAAYSTCVPTLAIGYSVKAKGIARDIFGSDERYVVPVQSLENDLDLVKAFKWLCSNEDSIRKHLKGFMPSYIAKAYSAGAQIGAILGIAD